MSSALIVSGGEKAVLLLTPVLCEASVTDIECARTAGEARRLLIDKDFGVLVINSPLTDETGEQLAVSAAEKGIGGVILLASAEHFDAVSARVENMGIITVSKPVNRAFFWSALKLALAAHNKMRIIDDENRRLLQKIEDIRIVDRAKCVLISRLSMTEPEAHRFIERQSMDMRMTRRAVAEAILKTYES